MQHILKRGTSLLFALALLFSLFGSIPPAFAAEAVVFPFVVPQQPKTALSDAPSISFFADTGSKNQAALNSPNRPASMMLRLNEALQVQNWDNKSLREVLGLMKGQAIPMFYLPNAETATAFVAFLDANQIQDGIIVSPHSSVLQAVRTSSKGQYLSGMLHITDSGMRPQDMVEACNSSMARSVWLPYQVTDPGLISYLQKRMVSVFISDQYSTVEEAVNLAPNGIMTGARVDALYAYYGRFSGDVPTFLRAPYIIAHRGLSYLAPENTLEGNRVAVQAGADIIETDVTLSKDGELVILHDSTVDRTTDGSGAVRHMTLAQIKALRANQTDLFVSWTAADFPNVQVPTLREMLLDLKDVTTRRDGDKVILLIDNKLNDPEMEQKIAAIVTELDMWDQVLFQTYSVPKVHQNSRTYLDRAAMGYLFDAADCPTHTAANAEAVMRQCAPYNATYHPGQSSMVTTEFIQAAGARGLFVTPWTYNWSQSKDNNGNTRALDRDFPKGLHAVITDRADLVARKPSSILVNEMKTPALSLQQGESVYLYAAAQALSGAETYASKTEALSVDAPAAYGCSGNILTGLSAGSGLFGVRALVENYALFAFGQATVSGTSYVGQNLSPDPVAYLETIEVNFINGKASSWEAQKGTFLDYVPITDKQAAVQVTVTEQSVSIARGDRAILGNQTAPSARALLSRDVEVSADDFLYFDIDAQSEFLFSLCYRTNDGAAFSFHRDQTRVNWLITGVGNTLSTGSSGSYQGYFRLRDALPKEAIWPDGTVKLRGIAVHAVGGGAKDLITLNTCWVGSRILDRSDASLSIGTGTGELLAIAGYDGFDSFTASLDVPFDEAYPLSSDGNYLTYTITKPSSAVGLAGSVSSSAQGEMVRDNLRQITPRVVDGTRYLDRTFTWLLSDGTIREETLTLSISDAVWQSLRLSVPKDGSGLDTFTDLGGSANKLLPMRTGQTYDIALTATFPSGLDAAGHEVLYTSSNEGVATVDAQGHIAAQSIGSAVITARTGSGLAVAYHINVKAAGGSGSISDEAVLGSPSVSGVSTSAWYYQDLLRALKNSVLDSTVPFDANRSLTRGEFVQWMAKTFDLTGTTDLGQFADSISAGTAPYAQACVAAGILEGSLRNGRYYFDEAEPLTRQQMIVMLVRAVSSKEEWAAVNGSLYAFPDQNSIGSWAQQAVAWAKREGIVIGDQNGNFGPKETMSYAAGMTAIVRAAKLL